MTYTIAANNVNEAYSSALHWLKVSGVEEDSRNGKVLVAPSPVVTTYYRPRERVLFSPVRDANPFFHFMESLWMLAGRDDVTFPAFFSSRFSQFSDDGETVNGAYGYRWRNYFRRDQLKLIADELYNKPDSRRAVLTMWSVDDLENLTSKDVPCNTQIYFDLRGGILNMTVCCRSNDAVWGAYGANVVHFSVLQEYIAALLNRPVGDYRQFSNNLHIYLDRFPKSNLFNMAQEASEHDYYTQGKVAATALVEDVTCWNRELRIFLDDPLGDFAYREPLFSVVAAPMYAAWYDRKRKTSDGLAAAESIAASDWRVACTDWIKRRAK